MRVCVVWLYPCSRPRLTELCSEYGCAAERGDVGACSLDHRTRSLRIFHKLVGWVWFDALTLLPPPRPLFPAVCLAHSFVHVYIRP